MIASENDIGKRLDVFVAEYTNQTRNHVQAMIDAELVLVNGKKENKNYRIRKDDEIETSELPVKILSAEPEKIDIDIVYEDEEIIVVNKPSGMVVHPAPGNESGTLVNALMYHCGNSLSAINGVIRPGIVHRIDKDTSGLLVVAKTDEAHLFLSSLLKNHEIKREYHAITVGHFKERKGTISYPIGRNYQDRKKMAVISNGKDAITHYEVIKEFKFFSYVKFELETGRTHQIRVHTSYLGHPIIGDVLYGAGKTEFEKKHGSLLDGQCLHAKKLSFPHPSTKEIMTFEVELPEKFKSLLMVLEKDYSDE